MSTEEALTLLLETSDQDTDAESDIDIISMQSPSIVSPQAVKISSPHEIDTTNAVYQNLEPITLHTSQSSTFPYRYVQNTHQQSSPSISPASMPSPPPCVITQHSLNFHQWEMPRKKAYINKPSSHITYQSDVSTDILHQCTKYYLPKCLTLTVPVTKLLQKRLTLSGRPTATHNHHLSMPFHLQKMTHHVTCLLNNFLVPLKLIMLRKTLMKWIFPSTISTSERP